MVAINGREVISRVIGVLRTNYKFLFGGRTTPGRSNSFAHPSLKQPFPNVAPLPAKKPISKRRKQNRVKRKRYDDLPRGNPIVVIPGDFPKDRSERKKSHQRMAHSPESDHQPVDCDSDQAGEGQTGTSARGQYGPPPKPKPANEEELIMMELDSLMFDKSSRESWFEVMANSERARAQAAEKETREAERLRKMWALERKEREKADSWKDRRLAQLERQKNLAQSELAREKVERKHSQLQRAFQDQDLRRKDQKRWELLMEMDANTAAEREANLLQENAMLQNNLQATGKAFRKARNERDHIRLEAKEEWARRLHVEESLNRWKELVKEKQQPQPEPQSQLQPLPEQHLSLEAQFEFYDKKWTVLRSRVDIDGSKLGLIYFSQIPWPVINMTPTHPSQIRPEHVQEFFMHPDRVKLDAQGKRKNLKQIAEDELVRWHPDRFYQSLLSDVHEEDKAAVAEVAGMVAKILINILR